MSRIGDKFDAEPPVPAETSPRNWAAEVNEILQELIDRVENELEPNHINILQTLDANGNDLSEVANVHFQPRAISGAANDSVYLASDDGEFYFTDGAGNDVKLTSNGQTNVSASSLISGDSADATIRYTDSTETFSLLHRATGDFSVGQQRELEVADDSDTYFATIDYVGGAANRTYTLSGELPDATSFVTLTPAGVVGPHEVSAPPSLTTTAAVTCTTADFTTERWRLVQVRSTCVLSTSTWTYVTPSVAGVTGVAGETGYVNINGTGWVLVDIDAALDDGDIVTGWMVPLQRSGGGGGNSTLRGSVCVSDASGSISVPGSLAETDTTAYPAGGTQYDTLQYTGASSVTVDRNGAGTSSDISRNYYFMLDGTGGGQNRLRYIMLKVKRG